MNKNFITITFVTMILVFAFVYAYLPRMNESKQPIELNGKACTQEARICPDGTAVGRAGSNCEFEPCPALINKKN